MSRPDGEAEAVAGPETKEERYKAALKESYNPPQGGWV